MCPGNNGGPGGSYPNNPPPGRPSYPSGLSSFNIDPAVARQQAQLQQQYQPTSSIFETVGRGLSGKGFSPTSRDIGFGIGGAMGGTPFGLGMYGASALAQGIGNFLAPDLDLTGSQGMTKEARTAAVKRMAGSTTVGNRVQGSGYTVYGTLSLEDTYGYLDKDRGEGGAEQRTKQRTEQGRSRVKVAASGKTLSVLSPAPDSLGDPRSPGSLPGRRVPRLVSRRSTILSGPRGLLSTENIGKPTLGA